MTDEERMPRATPGGEGGGAETFLPLDDLLAQLHHLAQDHPEHVGLFTYGRSRAGEALYGLRVGTGACRVLAYAFPQPDEPLGGQVILQLLQRLLQEEAWCRRATWTLLPCVDPDGARRNEGWFAASLDLAAYAGRHFRPPEGEQVEWSFPSDDPAWPWECLLPEAQALQALLDESRPHILFPLHNALLGGAYAFLSAEGEPWAPRLPSIWERHGLPTHRGEAELPFAPVLAPGVFRLPTLAEMAAALAAQGIADPPGLLGCGAPAYQYVRRRSQTLTLVPELPLFVVPGIDDGGPSGLSYRQLRRRSLAADRAAFAEWSLLYEAGAPFLGADNPYRSALEAHRRSMPALLEATAVWLATDAALERPATVAEVLDGQELAAYWRLLPLGMLRQAMEWPSWAGPAALREEVAARLETGLASTLSALPSRSIAPHALADIVVEMIERSFTELTCCGIIEPR